MDIANKKESTEIIDLLSKDNMTMKSNKKSTVATLVPNMHTGNGVTKNRHNSEFFTMKQGNIAALPTIKQGRYASFC